MSLETRAPRKAGGLPGRENETNDPNVAPAGAVGNAAESPLLTVLQTAAYLKVSVDTLVRWRIEGRGPKHVKFTRGKQGKVLYRIAELDRFILSSEIASTSDGGSR